MTDQKKFTFLISKSKNEEEEDGRILALENRQKEEKEKRESMVLEELRQANVEATGKTEQYDRGKMMILMIISNIIKFCIIAIMIASIIAIFIEIAPQIISFFAKLIKAIFF